MSAGWRAVGKELPWLSTWWGRLKRRAGGILPPLWLTKGLCRRGESVWRRCFCSDNKARISGLLLEVLYALCRIALAMAAPWQRDPGELEIDLTAVQARERFRIALMVWQRSWVAYFRRRIGWDELVFGCRRRWEGRRTRRWKSRVDELG